jgi:hypothetical protein
MDVSNQFMQKTASASVTNDVNEMNEWARSMGTAQAAPASDQAGGAQGENWPSPLNAKPVRRPTDDVMGRQPSPKDSTAGTIMRNVAEIPGQVAGGVHDAVMNATKWAIDPLANWLNENVADLTYDPKTAPVIHDAQTPTGAITRKISEFLTGFFPALKVVKGAGVTNMAVQGVTAGTLADFVVRSPHEGRLADIWNEAGLPKNVLTDYMASKGSGDGELEARFKNALESAGMGVAAEGIFMGARALRAARSVKQVATDETVYLKAKYGEVTDEQVIKSGIGDATKPAIEIGNSKTITLKKGEAPALEPRALIRKGALPTDNDVYINFARFDEPDSVKFAIGKMAEAMKGSIDEATRGKITQDETLAMAKDLGMTVEDLLARRKGQGFNAEEAVAARQLWAASGEKLVEAARKAAGKDASPLDHFAFRKMMATHSAIQSEVIGARTETARALAAWAIPAKGGIERSRIIDQALNATGGVGTSQDFAKRLAILADSGADPATVGRFAFKGYGSATADAVKEIWVNGLLSSPKTHVINTMSNTITAFQQIYERGAAAQINKLAGGGVDGVQAGEATAMFYGLVGGLKDSFRLAAQYLKTGESQFRFGKIDLVKPDALSAEAFAMSEETGLGRFLDFTGKVVGTPMHVLGAEDEFFKSIGYRMEVRAQALRTASQEGHKGADLMKRIAELTDNPTEAIRINSADAALYNTFTNEMGAVGSAIMNLRNIDSALNPAVFILPFVRTPVNIARYAFERTPFAPLVSQWRADIAAGGARADLALARMSTGTVIMLVAMDYADSGLISGAGPKDDDKGTREALTRQGWQPYSVKVGDRWVSYNRADPFGMTVGFAASINEAVKKGEVDENDVDEWQEVTAMAINAVSQVVISKTYLEGISNFVEMMTNPGRRTEKYVNDLFASFLPATSANAFVKNMVDPVQREAGSPMEAVQARIAGLSDNLPPRRDLWGKEISGESGLGRLYDGLTPAASKPIIDSPIDKEMVRLESSPERIGKKTAFDGVQVNFKRYPKAYDEYVRLAGNDLKHPAWQMGAKDYLNAVVSGNHPMSAAFSIMSDESRKAFIQNTVQDYRKLAQQQVLANPEMKHFAAEVQQLKAAGQNAKMPVMEGN